MKELLLILVIVAFIASTGSKESMKSDLKHLQMACEMLSAD